MESALAVLRRRAGTIAESIVRRAPRDSIRAIFAGGSVARGAVWAAQCDGRLEIYSDIDLYVVVRSATHADGVRAAAAEAIRDTDAGEPGVRYLRGVDAGVYTHDDLRAQPLRPGTADLAARHVALCGDADSIPSFLPPEAARIAPEEALYLLENRAWDAQEPAGEDPGRRRRRRVLSLKLDIDIAASWLIVAGADASAAADPVDTLARGTPPGVSAEVAARALRAGRARDDLASFFAGTSDVEDLPMAARVGAAWRELAPHILALPGGDDEALVAKRCHEGRRTANLREFVRVAACVGLRRRHALFAGLFCAARSPRATVRVHAIAGALAHAGAQHVLATHTAHAERVTLALGFATGTLDERVRATRVAIS